MLETIGWVYLGIMIGFLLAVFIISLLGGNRQAELEQENLHLRWVIDELKQEIFRIENRPKPKPRKNRKR